MAAPTRYRDRFRPSRWREGPYVMASAEALRAPADAGAQEPGKPAARGADHGGGAAGRGASAVWPAPGKAARERLPPEIAGRLAALRATQAHGSPRHPVRTRRYPRRPRRPAP